MMVYSSYVPVAFGTGITIPIPKNDCTRGAQKIESFRGITLSPVISKIFEHCIMYYFSRYLTTSDNQFAFKAKVGCSHTIYTLKTVIDQFVINDSTVSLGFLDMAKAFDKVCHHVLLIKLMKRRLPAALIKLFEHWYNIAVNVVRWGVALSNPYRLTSGVKQGSVISPTVFAVYVDDMLLKLQKRGCSVFGLNLGALMYADDLVLLSPSRYELQEMINICTEELALLDLKLNVAKTAILKIGKKSNISSAPIQIDHTEIQWAEEAKYRSYLHMQGPKIQM